MTKDPIQVSTKTPIITKPKVPKLLRLRFSSPGCPARQRAGTPAQTSFAIPYNHGRDVRERLGGFGSDRLLANAQADRGIQRKGEHHVGRVVREGASVPICKAEHSRSADNVGKHVRK